MAASVDTDVLHKQADNVWKMLDDMAESNPEAYKDFIDKILKEGSNSYKAPEPSFCVSTVLIPEVVTHKLFINICSWEKVPPPQTDKDPIPVMAGEVSETTDNDVTYSVVDVLFHPSILKGVENKKDHRNLLIHLAIDYLEDTKHIRLLRKYKNLKIKYKGDTKALKRFLSQGREKLPFMQGSSTAAGEIQTDSPQSLLQQLTSLNSTEKKKESSGINLFTPQQHVSSKAKKGLIQEISSSPVHSIPTVPHYEVVMKEPDEKYPKRIIVKVDLPCIESTRECELDVSEMDISVHVPNRYKLHVDLPDIVDEECTTASFNKTNHKLIIKLPVK